jgi:hypothetical protein
MKKTAFRVAGVLAGLVFAGAGIQERVAFSSVLSSGERAVLAPVTEYQQHGSAGSPTYTAELHFTTAAGQEVVVKHSFPEVVLEDFQHGVPVEIVYQPAAPRELVFVKDSPPSFLIWLGAGLAVGAFIFI